MNVRMLLIVVKYCKKNKFLFLFVFAVHALAILPFFAFFVLLALNETYKIDFDESVKNWLLPAMIGSVL